MGKAEGLYGKYLLRKTDGSDIDPNARYFVLRFDGHHRFMERAALKYYISLLPEGDPLKCDLQTELDMENVKEFERRSRAREER